MCNKIDNNLFSDDWAVCWYHDFGISWYRVVVMTHQTVSLGKYWKLFPATLKWRRRTHSHNLWLLLVYLGKMFSMEAWIYQANNRVSLDRGKLESEKLSLQKKLEENNISENEKIQIYSEIDVKILQREEISKDKNWGAILRSKSRWYNEGEQNTKYFLNSEKRHFSKKNHQTPHISKW